MQNRDRGELGEGETERKEGEIEKKEGGERRRGGRSRNFDIINLFKTKPTITI